MKKGRSCLRYAAPTLLATMTTDTVDDLGTERRRKSAAELGSRNRQQDLATLGSPVSRKRSPHGFDGRIHQDAEAPLLQPTIIKPLSCGT